MPSFEKQRTIALRHSVVGVPCGVADDIGFGLDDTPTGHAFG